MTQEELIEQLAEKEHASWSRYMSYFLGKCKQVPFEGTNNANLLVQRDLIIPAAYVEALQKQIDTPYAELSEQEKQYDRDEVDHILPVISWYAGAKIATAVSYTVEVMLKRDTPYADLPEQEKQSDRDEVAHILPIIEAYKATQSSSLLDQAALAETIARMDKQIRRLSAEVFATRITEQLDKIDDTRRSRQTLLGRVDELSHMVALGDVDQSFFVE